ncbi:MAG: beta-lactamase family protein, partial [Pyrinomonadaceae bacterium]|nr:beta-lactamase family protein [Pyrinomonadaceae bacterium]
MKYIATIIFCVIVPASYNFNDQNRWKTRELRSKLKSDAASLYRPISHEDEFLVRVEALRNYLKGYEPFGMSGTVLIAKDQKVVLHEAYGFADKLKGIKSDRNTVYDIASVGKQFTATAILKLQEANKLKVSARIGRYLTAVPEDKRAITIHQLLTHT